MSAPARRMRAGSPSRRALRRATQSAGRLHHREFARDVVGGDRHAEALLHAPDDVEIRQRRLDHHDVGAFVEIGGHLAQRLARVGRIHLVAAAIAKGRRRSRGLAERSVEGRRVLRRVRHDHDVRRGPRRRARIEWRRPGRPSCPTARRRRRRPARRPAPPSARRGSAASLSTSARPSRTHHDRPAVAVVGVLAQADVGPERQVGQLALQRLRARPARARRDRPRRTRPDPCDRECRTESRPAPRGRPARAPPRRAGPRSAGSSPASTRSRAARPRPSHTNSGAIRLSGQSRVSRTSRRIVSLRRRRRGRCSGKLTCGLPRPTRSRAAIASARRSSTVSRPRRRPPGQAREAPRSWSGQSTRPAGVPEPGQIRQAPVHRARLRALDGEQNAIAAKRGAASPAASAASDSAACGTACDRRSAHVDDRAGALQRLAECQRWPGRRAARAPARRATCPPRRA